MKHAKKTLPTLILVIGLLVSIFSAILVPDLHADSSAGASWPLRRHDLKNTGFTPSEAPDEEQILWMYNKSILIAASPAIDEYTVFIPGSSPNATLTALDAITGVPLWEIPQESGSVQPAGLDTEKGLVIYGTTDGHVKCVEMYTGAGVWDVAPWTVGAGGPGVYGWFVSAPQIDSVAGLVFIGTFIPYGSGYAYCLNETNGDVVWWWGPVYSKTMGTVSAVDGDVVFFGCSDDHLYAVNKFTGDTIWSFYVGMEYSHVISAPAISGDYLFVGGGSVGYMYCLNKTTGEEIWRYFGGNNTVGEMGTTRSPCIDEAKGWVIGTADNGTLYALDMYTGEQIWRTNLPYDEVMGQFQSMDPVLTGDGKIVINSHSNAWIGMGYEQLLVYNEADGELLWSYVTTPYATIPAKRPKALIEVATPCVAYNHIYVGCYDKLFYCFGEAWPYTVTITDPSVGSNLARGRTLTINCNVKDLSDNPVSGANVTAVISAETEPWGITLLKELVDTITLSETDTPGTYTGSYIIDEEDPIGKWNIIVKAVKGDEVGGSHTYVSTGVVPVASFTHAPTNPIVNETVTFDASLSTPNEGTIVSYIWHFGDGNYTTVDYPVITHVYEIPGYFAVQLKVIDSEGLASAIKTKYVRVYAGIAGAISVDSPTEATAAIGESITVTIIITNIADCAGYQLWIDYDSAVLEMVSWTFDTDPANPLSPTQMAPAEADRLDTDWSVPSSVKLATVWREEVPGYTYSGDSVAANVTFRGKMLGNSTLHINQQFTYAVDYYGDDIYVVTFNDGFIRVGPPTLQENTVTFEYYVVAGYEMVPTPPSPASSPTGFIFAVDPPVFNFGNVTYWGGRTYLYDGFAYSPYTNMNRFGGGAKVSITNLLGYDITILNLTVEVTDGTILKGFFFTPAMVDFYNWTLVIVDTLDPGEYDECDYNTGMVEASRLVDGDRYNMIRPDIPPEQWDELAPGYSNQGPGSLLEPDADGDAAATGHVAPVPLANGATFTEYFGVIIFGDVDMGAQINGTITLALTYEYRVPGSPIPRFTYGPSYPTVGETVTFNASASTPNGGVITSYVWDFGDGATSTGIVVTHKYTNAGTYTVELNVTDSEGTWSTTYKSITVTELPEIRMTNIDPEVGRPGTYVYVSGGDAVSNGEVGVFFDGANVDYATADSWGRWYASFNVPEVEPGTYMVTALDVTTGLTDSGNFTVLPPPILSVFPTEAPIGSLITISGEGFEPEYLVYLSFEDVFLTSFVSADENGEFNATVFVPMVNSGNYTIKALATYYYPYSYQANVSFTVTVGVESLLSKDDPSNPSYDELKTDYDEMNANLNDYEPEHEQLQSLFEELNSSYNELITDFNDLKSKLDVLTGDLGSARGINYIFILTTIIFIATTLYLATKKPRAKPAPKDA